MANVGYSGTPLAKKLGIAPSSVVVPVGAPRPYAEIVVPLPEGVTLARKVDGKADVIHLFTAKRAVLAKELAAWRRQMRPDAAIWVSWPKKASKMPTDITEDAIREVCLPMGLVDVKVCAVDEVWSGLKLVVRKELR